MSGLFQQISDAMADAVTEASKGVLRIEGRRRLGATAIAWRDNVVVTAHHVIKRDEGITIGTADGETMPAKLVGRDPNTDLAVLTVEQTLTPLPLAEADSLRVGHLVLALGRPGQSIHATHGVVSAINPRRMEGTVRTDVVMYPGFSGGPLLDASGHVQGMNTSGFNRGASLTITTAMVNTVVDSLMAHGKMRQGYLGVGAQAARLPGGTAQAVGQETGLLLVSVEPESPAETSGLLLGDVIVALDGEPTPHLDALLALLNTERIGQVMPVKVVRGGEVQEINVTVGEKV